MNVVGNGILGSFDAPGGNLKNPDFGSPSEPTSQTEARGSIFVETEDAVKATRSRPQSAGTRQVRRLTAWLCFAACSVASLAGCGNGAHKFDAVNKAAAALHLDSVGTTSSCVNRTGASFSGWTYCQLLVTAADAVAKVNSEVAAHGYTLTVKNDQMNQSVWKRGSGNSALSVTVDTIQAGSTYADLNGESHHVTAESALVEVQLGE